MVETGAKAVAEAAQAATKALRGTRLLSDVRDEDVQIATTPKDEVWCEDKVRARRHQGLHRAAAARRPHQGVRRGPAAEAARPGIAEWLCKRE